MRCFLDLDGVLCDLVKAIFDFFGDQVPNPWPEGVWNLSDIFSMSNKELWGQVDHDFWAEIPWTEDGQIIYRHCISAYGKDSVWLASTPTFNPESHSGKASWVRYNLPEMEDQLILISDKWLLANEDAILIDDYPVNCNRFVKHGGKARLIQRPWNLSAQLEPEVEVWKF